MGCGRHGHPQPGRPASEVPAVPAPRSAAAPRNRLSRRGPPCKVPSSLGRLPPSDWSAGETGRAVATSSARPARAGPDARDAATRV